MSHIKHRYLGCAAALAIVLLSSACTTMVQTPPGTSVAAVQAQWGSPNFTCQRPDGTRRLIWTQQPMGQYAWGTDTTPDGRIVRLESILSDEHFRLLDSGTWSAEQLRCEFGPPAQIDEVGLPSVRQVVWSYRYKQAGVWNSLMYVYLGRDGQQVTRHHPGPDPMFEEDRFSFW